MATEESVSSECKRVKSVKGIELAKKPLKAIARLRAPEATQIPRYKKSHVDGRAMKYEYTSRTTDLQEEKSGR